MKATHIPTDACCARCAAVEEPLAPMTEYTHSAESGVSHEEEGGGGESRQSLVQSLIAIALFLAALGTGYLLPRLFPAVAPGILSQLPVLFFAAATILAGWPVALGGIRAAMRLRLDEAVLMTIAVIAAFAIGEYGEGAMVAILFRLGELFESRAVASSRRGIASLANIRPDRARPLGADGTVLEPVPAQDIMPGTLIRVLPWERIPLDGIIEEGRSSLDTRALTGESLPRDATAGSEVLSGMLNGEGALLVRTTRIQAESAASRILDLVSAARARKGRAERLVTRFAAVYTPLVLIGALLISVIPPLLGLGTFTTWLSRALVFLVASCPCALVISVPLGFYAGIGAAAKEGILIKGGIFIEALARARAVVFDKTGTLTSGKLSLVGIDLYAYDPALSAGDSTGAPEAEALALAAALEADSSHPLGRALVAAATSRNIGFSKDILSSVEEFRGLGMRALLRPEDNEANSTNNGQELVLLGRRALLAAEGIALPERPIVKNAPKTGAPQESASMVWLARGGRVIACFRFADSLREDAPEAIRGLSGLGVKELALFSGDSEEAVASVAGSLGIRNWQAGLLPEEKLAAFEALRSRAGTSIFLGDGINDAPVLAAADCGMAMGLGSEAAIETADAVISSDHPSRLVLAIRLARRTMATIRFNIGFALGIKALVLVLAILGWAPMWAAVFADTGVAILTVLNAGRLRLGVRQSA